MCSIVGFLRALTKQFRRTKAGTVLSDETRYKVAINGLANDNLHTQQVEGTRTNTEILGHRSGIMSRVLSLDKNTGWPLSGRR